MLKNLAVLGSGVLFGLGLIISQMVNPKKVIGFLDITGNWDPSLAFVMLGALVILGVTQHFILKKPKPLLAAQFHQSTKKDIDTRLIVGASLFGLGWGLAGYCPGPALVSIAYGQLEAGLFCLAMFAGMWFFSWLHASK
ncbi:MAG: YeeE/YedE family protein [Methylococcales bacterium]|nr:YeeE/YedE family protein [Methylococcales bacterium]